MYGLHITRIRLSNVKAFKDLDLSFGQGFSSVLFTGDNGNGKSTLLRAIALGLGDEMGAYGLMSELSGSFVNYGATKAKIEIFLNSSIGNEEYKTQTVIEIIDKYGTQNVAQTYHMKEQGGRFRKIDADDFPLYNLFCTAYGTSCRTLGKERYHQYYHADSVYQLFKSDAPLSEQELSFRRILDYKLTNIPDNGRRTKRQECVFEILSDLINLPEGWSIKFKDSGIYFINGNTLDRKGKPEETALSAMGDGVRAITTLLLDMISWWHLYLDEIPDDEPGFESLDKKNLATDFGNYHGIIIIDEIEIHLHPVWRKQIISDLINNFPGIQFIFTTHSAMCVSGATDVADTDHLRFYRVSPDRSHELFFQPGTTANEILRTEAFGLTSTTGAVFEKKMDELDKEILENVSQSNSAKNVTKDYLKQLREKNPNQKIFEDMMSEHVEFIKELKKSSDR